MYVIVAIRLGSSGHIAGPIKDVLEVIELPEGANEDEVFVEWLKDIYGDEFEGFTDDEILENCMFKRFVREVLSV